MKLLKNFFTLVMVFTLIACSSDDDSVPYELNNTNLSTGSYGIQYLSIFDTETVNINGLDVVTEFSGTGETFQISFTFFENGTYILDGEYVLNSTLTVAGEVIEDNTIIIDVENQTGNYTANNSLMQLVLDGEEVWNVTLFNENELRFSYNNIYTEGDVDFVESGEIRMVR